MALIICSECGKEFSDKAPACPSCGCPTAIMFEEDVIEIPKDPQQFIYNPSAQPIHCPICRSSNILINRIAIGEKQKNRSEIRKKSIITRTGNKIGRAGMILATGGLWALTPKKSDYSEKKKGKTKIQYTKLAVCQDCGHDWEL